MNDNSTPTATLDVALIGAGKVGTAVAALLRRRGHSIVAITSRSDRSARRAARILDAPILDPDAWPSADLVLVGVSDGAIEPTAARLASVVGPDATAVHFAGAFGVSPLAPLQSAGVTVAALHPVQACPSVEAGIERLPGSAWGVTCADAVVPAITNLVRDELDGRPVLIPEQARPVWHAAAVTTSNGIAALLAAAEAMLAAEGIAAPDQVLGPLATGTLANALESGGGAASLTGPVVRGEAATIARHIAALKQRAPELVPQYLLAAQLMFAAASGSGRLDLDSRLTMSALLEDP